MLDRFDAEGFGLPPDERGIEHRLARLNHALVSLCAAVQIIVDEHKFAEVNKVQLEQLSDL